MKPWCAACKKRLAESEPDLELRRQDDGRCRYYHTRCMTVALEVVAGAPEVWLMSVWHGEEMAN
jgi:hypothetical protein